MDERNFLNHTEAQREQLFTGLYKRVFPAVARYVSRMGGSFDEARDIFQDALVIYYEKQATASLAVKTNEQAYIMGVAKHLWAKRFKDQLKNTPLHVLGNSLEIPETENFDAADEKLMHYLETAGQKCMEILRAFYYDNLPVNTIARLFGYAGERSATAQKYKCMEKVRETVKQKSLTYADFIE
jgi:DNA-directed RNA polymerase specialized sigma24 family protein